MYMDRIMNKYMQYKLTNIMFNNYFGRNGVQFIAYYCPRTQ